MGSPFGSRLPQIVWLVRFAARFSESYIGEWAESL